MYIRRFYPKNIQEGIIKCEMNQKRYDLFALNRREMKFILLYAMPIFLILLLIYRYLYYSINFHILLMSLSSSFLLVVGVVSFFHKDLEKQIYKEKYQDYQEYLKNVCADEKFFLKHSKKISIILILLSLVAIVGVLTNSF